MIYILGAGMAGCLAGIVYRDATILESGPKISEQHQAILRFRSDKISKLTGIPFKKVLVHKSIWFNGREQTLTPQMENLYSLKVIGRPTHRSISIGSYERWIAPDNFHALLGEMLKDQIHFCQQVTEITDSVINVSTGAHLWSRPSKDPIISTIPMPALARVLGIALSNRTEGKTWGKREIVVARAVIPDADVYQTIYFPSMNMATYRASMSGDKLIIEMLPGLLLGESAWRTLLNEELPVILTAFGLQYYENEFVRHDAELLNKTINFTITSQAYGKISSLPDNVRKQILFAYSSHHNVWSLGRFACWRNVLLDDVYEDIYKIRAMIGKTAYDTAKSAFLSQI